MREVRRLGLPEDRQPGGKGAQVRGCVGEGRLESKCWRRQRRLHGGCGQT